MYNLVTVTQTVFSYLLMLQLVSLLMHAFGNEWFDILVMVI